MSALTAPQDTSQETPLLTIPDKKKDDDVQRVAGSYRYYRVVFGPTLEDLADQDIERGRVRQFDTLDEYKKALETSE